VTTSPEAAIGKLEAGVTTCPEAAIGKLEAGVTTCPAAAFEMHQTEKACRFGIEKGAAQQASAKPRAGFVALADGSAGHVEEIEAGRFEVDM